MPSRASRSSKKSSKSSSSKASASSKNGTKQATAPHNPAKVQKPSSATLKSRSVSAASSQASAAAKPVKPFVAAGSWRARVPSSSGASSSATKSSESTIERRDDMFPVEVEDWVPVIPEEPLEDRDTDLTRSKKIWANNRLLVVTEHKLIALGGFMGRRPILESSSQSIRSAAYRRTDTDGTVLAIADSYGMLLHDMVEQHGICQLVTAGNDMLFSPDGSLLLFRTPLSNSVQIFDINNNTLLSEASRHASTIACMSLSTNSDLLLSASSSPSMITIDNRQKGTSTTFVPKITDSCVIACEFHPTKNSLFLLAFKDGTVAAFDYNKINQKGQGLIGSFDHLHEATLGGNGLVDIKFLPGTEVKGVSIGEDARVLFVDFALQRIDFKDVLSAPATAIAVRSENNESISTDFLVAVSDKLGSVHLFNDRMQYAEQNPLLSNRAEILALQFTTDHLTESWRDEDGDDFSSLSNEGFILSDDRIHATPVSLPDYLKSSVLQTNNGHRDVEEEDAEDVSELQNGDLSYMNTFSPVKQDPPKRRSARLSSGGGRSVKSHKTPSSPQQPVLKKSGVSPPVSESAAPKDQPVPKQKGAASDHAHEMNVKPSKPVNSKNDSEESTGSSNTAISSGGVVAEAKAETPAQEVSRILKGGSAKNLYATYAPNPSIVKSKPPTATSSSNVSKKNVVNNEAKTVATSSIKRKHSDDEEAPAANGAKRQKTPPTDARQNASQGGIVYPEECPSWLPILVGRIREDFDNQLAAQDRRHAADLQSLRSEMTQQFSGLSNSLARLTDSVNNISESSGSMDAKIMQVKELAIELNGKMDEAK